MMHKPNTLSIITTLMHLAHDNLMDMVIVYLLGYLHLLTSYCLHYLLLITTLHHDGNYHSIHHNQDYFNL